MDREETDKIDIDDDEELLNCGNISGEEDYTSEEDDSLEEIVDLNEEDIVCNHAYGEISEEADDFSNKADDVESEKDLKSDNNLSDNGIDNIDAEILREDNKISTDNIDIEESNVIEDRADFENDIESKVNKELEKSNDSEECNDTKDCKEFEDEKNIEEDIEEETNNHDDIINSKTEDDVDIVASYDVIDSSLDISEDNNEAANDSEITNENLDDSEDERKENSILKEIMSYLIIILIALGVAIVVNTFILSNTRIPTGSMENTIMKGDRLFGFRLSYKFDEPKRGDIIIFKYPDDRNKNFIKRIIGLPGETINIYDGTVYVDGEPIDESSYLKEDMKDTFGPFVVPEDSYFVMGDNRNESNDSRYWDNKFVPYDDIVAKAIIKYYPSISFVE